MRVLVNLKIMGKVDPHSTDFDGLPGADLVVKGLEDLAGGVVSEPALLVAIAAQRLRRLGIVVPETTAPYPRELALYALLENRLGTAAHSRYNSLLRQVNSFAAALEREGSARKASEQ